MAAALCKAFRAWAAPSPAGWLRWGRPRERKEDMLSRHRHHRLVEPLCRDRRPVLRRGPFSLYWLTAPDERTPAREAELVIVHDLPVERIDNNAGRYILYDLLPLVAQARERY